MKAPTTTHNADNKRFSGLIKALFYGNYFYGICAVALCVETLLERHYALPGAEFFLGIFCCTVFCYRMAYIGMAVPTHHPIEQWFVAHKPYTYWVQGLLAVASAGFMFFAMFPHFHKFWGVNRYYSLLTLLLPMLWYLYYGLPGRLKQYGLRNHILGKPIIIGLVWAGLVSFFPILYADSLKSAPHLLRYQETVLFIQNFMYIFTLAILFDIKDYSTDSRLHLNTIIIKLGLRKTLFYLILPMVCAGLGLYILYGILHHFGLWQLLWNVLPYLLLLAVVYSLKKRKPFIYYMAIVDGLMLAKAVCGIIGSVGTVYF
ncbi:MAG: hypothetical protein EBX41_07260 [Chitinophagia bacterium]|nr:hypothetical protein [Chitinophagia bacterium]